MGSRAVPIIAYGFNLGAEEEGDLEGVAAELIEASDNMEDGDWPVELISHGYHDYRFFFLAVRGTKKRGSDWGSAIPISAVPPTYQQVDAAQEWCEKRGIKWHAPQWCAMASYS